MSTADLLGLDYAFITLYFVGLGLIIWSVNRHVGDQSSEAFFLGGRGIPWWGIGCSLFASNLGTDHLVGLTGSGAASGLAVGNYEWSACFTLLLLGWLFSPHYFAHKIFTAPEYLERRFSPSLKRFFMVLTIVTIFLTKITVTLLAGAVVLNELLGLSMWVSSALLLFLTALYTTVGGLAAVIFTEVLQSGILILGTVGLLVFSMEAVGGWEGLVAAAPKDHMTLMKPLDDPDFPWLGVLLGMPIVSVWYWCTDQVMVQRVLATENVEEAQKGCIFAGWLKILPMYIMVLPGVVAGVLFPEETKANSNASFALLVKSVLPVGWVGLMLATMLSSFMSALASCFNSCSTLFTMDIFMVYYPESSERTLVLAGRAFTVAIALFSLAWLPVILNTSDQLFLYIQSMQIIWCAPVAIVFLGSFVSEKVSTQSAWVTLIAGLAMGAFYWVVHTQISRSALPMSLIFMKDLCILHFNIISFVACAAIMTVSHYVETAMGGEVLQPLLRDLHAEAKPNWAKQTWAGDSAKVMSVGLVVTVCTLTVLHSTILA